MRGREVSHRKELDTRVSLDSHTKEYFLGLSVDLAFQWFSFARQVSNPLLWADSED